MNLYAFSFLDQKTGIFSAPFFMAHPGQAVRAAMELGQDRNTTIARHPADYQLCQIGTFDDQTADLARVVPPIMLGTVASFLPSPTPPAPLFQMPHGEESELTIPPAPNGRA